MIDCLDHLLLSAATGFGFGCLLSIVVSSNFEFGYLKLPLFRKKKLYIYRQSKHVVVIATIVEDMGEIVRIKPIAVNGAPYHFHLHGWCHVFVEKTSLTKIEETNEQ